MRTNDKVQVILYRNSTDPLFLLLKTNRGENSIWQGVTGGVGTTDKSLKKAAVREVREELGINIDEDNLIGPLHKFQFTTKKKGYEGKLITEYCFGCELPNNVQVQLSEEHKEFEWLSFNKAVVKIDHDNPKVVLRKVQDLLLRK